MAVSCIIWDKAKYWWKIVIFSYPLHSTPPLRRSPSEYCHPVWYEKTIMMDLPDGEKKYDDMVTSFDRIHEFDRQTDIYTYTAWRHRPRLFIASRGKSRVEQERVQQLTGPRFWAIFWTGQQLDNLRPWPSFMDRLLMRMPIHELQVTWRRVRNCCLVVFVNWSIYNV